MESTHKSSTGGRIEQRILVFKKFPEISFCSLQNTVLDLEGHDGLDGNVDVLGLVRKCVSIINWDLVLCRLEPLKINSSFGADAFIFMEHDWNPMRDL